MLFFTNHFIKLSREALTYMSWKRIGSNLKKLRRKLLPACPDIATFVDLLNNDAVIKEKFGTYRNEEFYRDTIIIGGNEYISVFAVEQMLSKVDPQCILNADGTFGIQAPGFHQLYITMAKIAGKNKNFTKFLKVIYLYFILGKPRPIIYALMTSRTRQMYAELFRYCRDNLGIDPSNIMTDFEIPERKAALDIWPGVHVWGCNFHFCKAVFRNALLHLGVLLKIRRYSNESVKYAVKLFQRLSLLPKEDVFEGLQIIRYYLRDNNLTAVFAGFYRYNLLDFHNFL